MLRRAALIHDVGRFGVPGYTAYCASKHAVIGFTRLARNAGSETDKRLIVLTDLGMLAKKALDGSRDVFVQSISSGRPVAGADVRAIARNGETLAQAAQAHVVAGNAGSEK